MVDAAWGGAAEADLIVLLVDATRGIDDDGMRIIEGLRQAGRKATAAINKVDAVAHERLLPLAEALDKSGVISDVFMISALEGWQFVGPKGINRIRQQDHALLQPMYQVRLRTVNGRPQAVPVKTFSPGNLQPPVSPFK